MFTLNAAGQTDIPGSALPTWLTLAVGAIALVVVAAWPWIRKPSRRRVLAVAGIIPFSGAILAGALYLGSPDPRPSISDEGNGTVPISEDVDIQLPTLGVTD